MKNGWYINCLVPGEIDKKTLKINNTRNIFILHEKLRIRFVSTHKVVNLEKKKVPLVGFELTTFKFKSQSVTIWILSTSLYTTGLFQMFHIKIFLFQESSGSFLPPIHCNTLLDFLLYISRLVSLRNTAPSCD